MQFRIFLLLARTPSVLFGSLDSRRVCPLLLLDGVSTDWVRVEPFSAVYHYDSETARP